ncbi:hypothetical protein NUU61_003400 [Penicillium alfredii]|uniref:Uncharacterized protein n=1 Tax=Penicillium alfredii TaxID=1506179 RepID=A0A9W9FTF8_9EURO|nr:uncharacterized protein NUU61_003400 [Penicillium alfredii]KAJ5106053.1 hypothetical protein NUU61_003400 [Penicillium alfredii]
MNADPVCMRGSEVGGEDAQRVDIGAHLGLNGIGNLEFCVLGSGQRCFARWLNGIWSSWTSDEINTAVVKYNSYRDCRIVAMAFGYGDSYVISYGTASNMKQLGNWFDLKGYYPDLYQTLQSNKPLSIYAIALDPTSTTNYILVWGYHKDGLYRSWWDQEYVSIIVDVALSFISEIRIQEPHKGIPDLIRR